MKTNQLIKIAGPAALLIAATTAAGIAPLVDGTRDTEYGGSISNQGASVIEVLAGEDLAITAKYDNSNIEGVAAFGGGAADVFPPNDSDPALVTTGWEFSISLDEIEYTGGPLRIAGLMGDDGFVSNQVVGGLPADSPSLGDAVDVDFSTIAGDQFVSVSNFAGTAATVDGTLDASYGSALWVNNLASSFGSNDPADPVDANLSDGSEFNAIYAYADATNLYVFIAGNQQTSFDTGKIKLFIDSIAGGQNVLDGDGQPGADFGLINSYDGLAFDTGFTANYFISMGNNQDGQCLNFQDIPVLGGGSFGFGCEFPRAVITSDQTDPADQQPPNGGTIVATIDNSNNGGVAAVGFEDDFWVSDPETVQTGFEFKIDLDRIGYDGGADIKIGGYVVGGDLGFISNQVIGGLDTGVGNIGGFANPASNVDWTTFAGDQFVSYTVPAAAMSNITIDGSIAGDSQYTLVWENDVPAGSGNATEFGDNTDPSAIEAGGSEINALRVFVGQDPANGMALTLFGHVSGNLETNSNRLALFIDADTTPGVGQNVIRTDNFAIDNDDLNNNTGGMTWDAGFEPDFLISYGHTASARFASGAQLLAAGGGFGGQFFNVPQDVSAATGDLVSIVSGFGDNSDPSSTFANGSELNNFSAIVDQNFTLPGLPTSLHLFLGGNLESNNNKIEIFIDVDPARGQNTLIWDDPENPTGVANPDVNFNALNRMGGPTNPVFDDSEPPVLVEPARPGLTFDAGFTADYYLTAGSSDGVTWFVDFARLYDVLIEDPANPGNTDPGEGRFVGSYTMPTGTGESNDDGTLGVNESIGFAVNNSNTAGVDGAEDQFGDVSGAASVTTGIEVAIPLTDINWSPSAGDSIKVIAFINGQAHDFVSNQILGYACVADLGEPREVNFDNLDGPQFVQTQWFANGSPLNNIAGAGPDCVETVLCAGDVNGDEQVNTADLLALLASFGNSGAVRTEGDLNGDGDVNTADLLILLANFGQGCNPE